MKQQPVFQNFTHTLHKIVRKGELIYSFILLLAG